ncbi:11397_t:CDS:2 [Acaulospora morrowiae]|uniref:11397_t:CDS:1 n=1 Tax=Acaulospora morrowiae TaxID=94023 RepID=A0A9N8WI72_9GLOM|nr:11397_t:CDS:2 [Acaulospora morrowiae]
MKFSGASTRLIWKIILRDKSSPKYLHLGMAYPIRLLSAPVNCFRIEDELGLFFPVLAVHCLECGYFFDYLGTNGLEHNNNCSVIPKYSKRRACEIIQRRFRSWMKIRTNSAKIIQRAVIPWLFRLNGPFAKKALNRYHSLAMTQTQSK